MPLIIASVLLIGQWCFILCSTLSFMCGQLCIVYDFSFCRFAFSQVAVGIFSVDVHTGIFTDVLIAYMFMLMPVISWFFFSVWLFQHSQSAMYSSEPCLYMMHTQYYWMCIKMHHSHWNSMTTSLLIIADCGLWSVLVHTFSVKQ